MATADLSSTTTKIKRHYDTYPYPLRDPAEEPRRLSRSRLDELDRLNHYCYRGRMDFLRGFRALVAGGGTGDASIFLAHQLVHTDAAVVHLDLSRSAIDVARQRARRRGLEQRITWIEADLLDLPRLGLEPFDYINCSGVLHHLESPADGLAALVSVLQEGGALGLMLYGRYGRMGIYPMQQLMRLILQDEDRPQVMVEHARAMLQSLPNTNWFRRLPALFPEDAEIPDTELYDMFLHARDRAYSVLELYELLDGADLHLIEFAYDQRAMYDPRLAFRSEKLASRVSRLPPRHQQAAAELFWGTIFRHVFWASRQPDTVADPRDPENVPAFSKVAERTGMPESLLAAVHSDVQIWRPSIQDRHGMTISFQIELNAVNRQFLRLIDDRRTMGEIVEMVVRFTDPHPTEGQVWDIACDTLEELRKFDYVALRHVSAPPVDAL